MVSRNPQPPAQMFWAGYPVIFIASTMLSILQ
jgi:hypothetical protein